MKRFLQLTISSLDAVEVQLSDNAVPVRCPPIKQSEEDEQMIEDEVQDMLKKGIISKVENSRWIFPFFVVRSNAGAKVRSFPIASHSCAVFVLLSLITIGELYS